MKFITTKSAEVTEDKTHQELRKALFKSKAKNKQTAIF